MDEKTLTALQGSISKWEAIVAGTGDDLGTDNCPLCLEFADKHADVNEDEPRWASEGCFGCPVAEKVGTHSCCRTPYQAWANHSWDVNGKKSHPYTVKDDKGRQLAQAELDFLKSLVPQRAAAR
jgi:hypothetical protein